MESLDQTGRDLYTAYVKARDAWISYITPQAITRLNSYLSSTGRHYYKYEYYADTHGYMKDNPVPAKPKSRDMDAKYKKLCILFHPDKFNHPSSTELFHILKKWFDAGNLEMLDILDRIAHFILEIPPSHELYFTNMLVNLANPDLLHLVKSNCRDVEDAIAIFDLLNTDPNKLSSSSNTNNTSNDNDNGNIHKDMKPENFINTNAYKFFMNEESIRLEIEEIALTEAELIDYIKQQGKYDDGILAFYGERYRDNENILRAITEMQMLKNEELKKENERLRAKLSKMHT
jgi:hypothetical protein